MSEKYAVYDTFTGAVEFYEKEETALKDYNQASKDISEFLDREDLPEYVYLFQIVKQEEIK